MFTPEILAPCGEFNSVIYAINAGADAVYLGGEMFSARAYASNLSNDQIIEAIKYAHLHNAKVYLTLNTLIKNKEIEQAINMIRPLYENGLDAIIIQDFGLLKIISDIFPSLDIHASTQMSIMSHEGIKLLKKYNVTRVVPARELSINEIEALKKEGLEIECFVHGAMCYSYSGKCLFSSIAGGRSGNRGRCAGPCRKPYEVLDENKKTILNKCYPLSMKDMCTIQNINQLIDAKVDSFKIEGRMKAPEYSAGVSEMYYKYANLYMDSDNNSKVSISKNDKKLLSNLYVRSNLQEGYLNKHNGKDMISLSSPAYNSVSKDVTDEIKEKYQDKRKVPVSINITFEKGKNITGNISLINSEGIYYECEGDLVLEATNRPMDDETIKKQMCKLGNTNYVCESISITTDNLSFLPVSALNEFRRKLIEGLDNILFAKRFDVKELYQADYQEESYNANSTRRLLLGLLSKEQLTAIRKAANKYDFKKEYIIDIFSEIFDDTTSFFDDEIVYIRIPAIVRENKLGIIKNKISNILDKYNIAGVYINSIDGLMLARQFFNKEQCYGDIGLYIFNDYANDFFKEYLEEYTVSLEHNEKELLRYKDKTRRQIQIYGYLPLMYSANCIVNTAIKCDKSCNGLYIKDESGRLFYSKCCHELCYNTVYNNVPVCFFNELNKLDNNGYAAFKIEFTIENKQQVEAILDNYINNQSLGNNNYTLGHYKRGVE